jgi:hypothetical protein
MSCHFETYGLITTDDAVDSVCMISRTARIERRLVIYMKSSLVSVGNASKLVNNKLGAHVLHISIIRVGKMFSIDAFTIVGANTIALDPELHKARGNTIGTIVF